jgi:hypothetical protein
VTRKPQGTTIQISSPISCSTGLGIEDALVSETFKVSQIVEGFEERRIVLDVLQRFSRELELAT